jgi:hypothetical protein
VPTTRVPAASKLTGPSRNGHSRAVWLAMGVVAFGTGAISHERERPVASAAVPVRYTEGTVHGFLELTTAPGALLAHGDLLQVARNGAIESRMVFHLDHGSVFDEAVTFTQQDVFTMQTYHLVQSGPAFADDLDASLSRSGSYVVKAVSHKDGRTREYAGSLALPGDVYNGMVSTIAKNISTHENTTVHIVAFTPEPRLIALELSPSGSQRVLLGQHEETAVNFAVKPKLGFLLNLGATLTGKVPSDSHVWIITDGVPAFVRSEGPLYTGPVWRIALTSPVWPR